MTSNFVLTLGRASGSKDEWLGHGRAPYTPSLDIRRSPNIRIRQAVRGEHAVRKSKSRLISDNNVALLERFSHRWELRNVDKARMTSLSWAAAEGRTAVFEWLLLDHGHDDQELSRVSAICKRQRAS
jgi:hypothetical protein